MRAREKGLEIRRLRPAELQAMKAVWKRAGLPYRPRGRDRMPNLRRQLSADPESFLGAFLSGEMVGVILVSDDGRKGWINRLAVIPEARGHGIAKALIAEAEHVLRRRGRRLISVLIETYNKDSMRLFEQSGYRREDDIIYFTKRDLESY